MAKYDRQIRKYTFSYDNPGENNFLDSPVFAMKKRKKPLMVKQPSSGFKPSVNVNMKDPFM